MLNLLKWWMTIKVSWAKYTAYRMNFFLTIVGPALIFFFIKYNLWSSIYNGDKELIIQGFNLQGMITYHIWALIVSLLAQGHASWNMSDDIRLGRISSYLIYPFNFWEFHTASFLSFQVIQIFIATITLAIILMLGLLELPGFSTIMIGLAYTITVSFFWFVVQYFTGLLAFWLEETWILRVILSIVTAFLSGAIIPLDLYPKGFVEFLNYTPFPYLSYYPIKIFMGETIPIAMALSTMGFWMVALCILNHFLWKKGVRLYTAAGM